MLAPGSATGIMQPAISIPFSAEVAKSVDAVDSKSTVEIRAGSSPAFGTKSLNYLQYSELDNKSCLFCL